MSLEYKSKQKLEALGPVLDEHADWYGLVVRALAYPEHKDLAGNIALPDSFQFWAEAAEEKRLVVSETLEQIKALHHDLIETSKALLGNISKEQKTTIQQFDEYKNLYDDFIHRMRRLEKDSALEGSGIDEETGLRSIHAMDKDLKVEMERRARRGNPFCLALVYIDNFEKIAELGKEERKTALDTASGSIKQCMRTFDDAYRKDDGSFVLCLKHADIAGAQAAVLRLRNYMAEANEFFKTDGENHPLTMSYCIAEPSPGDSVMELLQNMAGDLEDCKDETDVTLQFKEVSPLQRYVSALDQ